MSTSDSGPVLTVSAMVSKPVVERIHTQLECLKYVGTVKNGFPSGEGIDVSVLLLPDLVFDFRSYNLHPKPDGPRQRVCAVGGRAARIACALLHLQDEYDATFRVHLATRTGNLGRLLVADEFTADGANHPARHVDLETVIPRDDQPRCALVNSPSHDHIDAQDAEDDFELNASDLRRGRLNRLLETVKAICLTSITTPHFAELLSEIIERVNHPGRLLFVDATRPHGSSDLVNLIKILQGRKSNGKMPAAEVNLFVPTVTLPELVNAANCAGVPELCSRLDVAIVEYGAAAIYHSQSEKEIQRESILDFDREDVPERFKAGVLLARTLYHSLADVKLSGELAMHTALMRQWSTDEWEDILDYGLALASTDPAKDLRGQVLGWESAVSSAHYPGDHFPGLPNATVDIRGEHYRRIRLDQSILQDLARLAGHRRVACDRKEPNPLCPDLAVCSFAEQKCATCSRRDPFPPTEPTAAVMVDLDSTLMNSTEQRKFAVLSALQTLIKADALTAFESVEQAEKFFAEHVYGLWALYANMRIGDFRQVWNHQGWYASLIALAGDQDLAKKNRSFWTPPPNGVSEHEHAANICRGEGWKQHWPQFYRRYLKALRDYPEQIRAARASFEEVQLHPLKEARDFLKSLQQTGALCLYIVSEGDPETQWQKIKRTGLDDFVKRNCVLTTGEAASPTDEIAGLMEERGQLERESAQEDAERKALENQIRLLGGMKELVKALGPLDSRTLSIVEGELAPLRGMLKQKNARIAAIDRQLQAAKFVGLVLDRMSRKGGRPFYSAVIRAILRNPDSPRDELRSFARLVDGTLKMPELKFAMIGDRLDYDIEPPSMVLGSENVATIHFRCGSHGKERAAARPSGVQPHFVADTLAQAKAILLDKGTWDAIQCKGDPPIFDWKIDMMRRDHCPDDIGGDSVVGINVLLNGIRYPEPDGSIISRVCAGVLAEHLVQVGSPDNFEKVLLACREIDPDSSASASVGRASLLCALVDAGLALAPQLAEMAREILRSDSVDIPRRLPGGGALSRRIKEAIRKL